MPTWSEAHYHRAAEFVQLIATAIGQPPAAPVAPAAPVSLPRPPGPPAKAPAPASPTAAAVFKTIPWKK